MALDLTPLTGLYEMGKELLREDVGQGHVRFETYARVVEALCAFLAEVSRTVEARQDIGEDMIDRLEAFKGLMQTTGMFSAHAPVLKTISDQLDIYRRDKAFAFDLPRLIERHGSLSREQIYVFGLYYRA
jgi:hypothetical protein